MPARFIIVHQDDQNMLVPFEWGKVGRYILAERRDYPDGPPIRKAVLDKLRSRHKQSTLDAWLWPPYGEIGIWNDHTRTFSSVYDRRARQHGIKIPPEVVKRHGITDEASLERVIHDGSIV